MSLSVTDYLTYKNSLSAGLTGQVGGTSTPSFSNSGIEETESDSSGFCFEAALASMISQSKEAYQIIADHQEAAGASLEQAVESSLLKNIEALLGSMNGNIASQGLTGSYPLYQMVSSLAAGTNISSALPADSGQTADSADKASEKLNSMLDAYRVLASSSTLPATSEETLFSMLNGASASETTDYGMENQDALSLSRIFEGIAKSL